MNQSSPLILADRSPCLRLMALLELFPSEADREEIMQLESQMPEDPLVISLVERQRLDGSWPAEALSPQWGAGGEVQATAAALMRLGYLGFKQDFGPVKRGIEYLVSKQLADGSWPLARQQADFDGDILEGGVYSMIPLQTAIPLYGLAMVGASQETYSEKAYRWLLDQRLDDGAWPTGLASGVHGYVAGYRRLAHSRWGCRSNTTGALLCLAHHPVYAHSDASRRGMDLLLGQETHQTGPTGYHIARMIGYEPNRGFVTYYRVYDLAQILDLGWRIGASLGDERIRSIFDVVCAEKNRFGLWTYPGQPRAVRWISFDIARSIKKLNEGGDWVGSEPETPFQAYPRKQKRF